jgi:hypothetical protein
VVVADSGMDKVKGWMDWLQHIDLIVRWGGWGWVAAKGAGSVAAAWLAGMLANKLTPELRHWIEFVVFVLIFGLSLLIRDKRAKRKHEKTATDAAPKPDSPNEKSLPDRIFMLCKDLSFYLADRPERPDENKLWLDAKDLGARVYVERYNNEFQTWDDKLSAGYWLQFKDKAANLRHELALRSVFDAELDEALTQLDKQPTGDYKGWMTKLIARFRYQASTLD